KVNEDTQYAVLAETDGINDYSKLLSVQIPMEQLSHGDVVTLRAWAVDAAGLRSEDLTASYTVDLEAPEIENLSAVLEGDTVTLTWTGLGESDASGYRVYRSTDGGSFRSLGSRSAGANAAYTFIDQIPANATHTFVYKVSAVDRLGNARPYTQEVAYVYERINEAPVISMNVPAYLEIGVEQYFDASGSTDDSAIESWLWDFGDGTTSQQARAVKKYTAAGTYEVTLTLTDDDGVSTSQTRSVEVRERTQLGTLNVKVVDENYNPLPNVKVLIDRGASTQCTLTTDGRGIAAAQLPGGEHEVAAYMDSSHLPAKKTVTVLENATRTVTLILVEEDLVTGEFEITRMDLDEIVAAGIDVYDPANQNIYQVQVRVIYGGSPLTIRYQRNDSQVLSYSITDSSGNPVSTVRNSGGEARKLTPTVISCGSGSTDIVAILDIPAQVSYLKEFFDVKLYITNNAAQDFVLTDNEVTLNVPEGMTLMKGLASYEDSNVVRIASIAGQETRMLNWCLRGDTEGDYELSADYVGTLDYFDEIVTATFTADEPIKVYGMNGVEVSVLACDVIRNGAFYFKIGLENKRPIDLYMPNIGLYGMVENVTEEVLHGNPSGNFYVQSYVLNTYVESESGARQYLPIRYDSNGEVIPQVSVLAPGQKLVYEYVCYNAIKDDTVGYFQSSMATVLSGYAENVVTGSYTRSEASLESFEEKLDRILSRNDEEINAAYDYIMSDGNYYYVSAARDSSANTLSRIYKLLDLGLDLDLEYFTMDKQRDLAQQIILQILLDQETIDSIDDQVMLKYLDAVTNSISRVKDAFKAGYDVTSADFDGLVKLGREDLVDLTKTLATEGRDRFEEELYELIANRVTGFAMATTAEAFYESLGLDEVVSFDGIVDAGEMMTDTILNGLNALDSTMESAYIYSTLYANASSEFSNYVLDAIISYCAQRTLDSVTFQSIMNMSMFPENFFADNQIDRLAIAIAFTAKEDKLAIREDEAARAQIKALLAGQFVGEMAASTAASIAKEAIKEALGAPYVIAGVLWDGLDHYFGFESYVEQQDSMVVYDYMASALAEPVLAYIAQGSRTEDYDLYTLSLLKALCRMRLDGEHHYRESVVMFVDREAGRSITEAEAIALINDVMGTSYTTLDEWYSELRYNINSARDILFNKEITAPVTVPDAPAVSLDYERNQTRQSFSDAYEYCFADGEWIACDGGPIRFTPKRTQTVLRVRVKATDTSLAGRNKTVYIYAQKELSKLITVRRDGAQYIAEQLKAGRTYQMIFPQADAEAETYDWSDAVTFTADGNGTGTVTSAREADRVVIRSTISDADRETYSEPLPRPISRRQQLPLEITGAGSVTQTRTDGRYFFGDTVALTAVPNDGQTFEGWYADGALVSEEPGYLFEMGSAQSLEARFTGPQIAELIVSVMPEKLDYTHAEALSLDGLVLSAAYSDGTRLELTDYSAVIDTSDFDHPVIVLRVGSMQTSIPITFEHDGAWIVQKEPTCTEPGYKSFTCTLCNETSTVELEALGHDWDEGTIAVEPTCTEAGEKHYTCSRCGQTRTEVLDALGHYLIAHDAKAPTCTEIGWNAYETCARCDYTTYVELPALGHDLTAHEAKAPTCTEIGWNAYETCSRCDYTTYTELPALGHDWSDWTQTKAPTCTEAGEENRVCSRCGLEEARAVEALGHDLIHHEAKAATCTEIGWNAYETCSRCDYTTYAELPALGHDLTHHEAKTPTCTEIGWNAYDTCSRCDYTTYAELPALGHDLTDHEAKAPTCTEPGWNAYQTCTRCDYTTFEEIA
ncbi:MAG: PKD domain-containing protein, partial [Oscillospiraceae bacterium]|nr:PKD domain-containing protein [Oscillospiraceae bacterium]